MGDRPLGDQAPVFHIGFPKTGSTWLQQQVFPRLQHVVYQRDRARWRDLLFWADNDLCLPRTDRPILISDENLVGSIITGGSEMVRQVLLYQAHLPEARLLLFFRSQVPWLRSAYQEYVRWGGRLPVNKWLTSEVTRIARPDLDVRRTADWDRTYSLLQEHTADDQVLFLPIEGLFAGEPSVVRRLSRWLGPDLAAILEEQRREPAHRSISRLPFYVSRAANRFVPAGGAFDPDPAGKRAWVRSRHYLYVLAHRISTARGRRRLQDGLEKRIENNVDLVGYAEGNRRLAERLDLPLGRLGYPCA